MKTEDSIKDIIDELFQYQLLPSATITDLEQLRIAVAGKINFLIINDFEKLISILYRLDISEKKLTVLLKQPADLPAGNIIAEMIIERQLEKAETRKQFKNSPFCDEERW